MEILQILSSYLPHPLAARILEAPDCPLIGWHEYTDAVAIFADLAGFTPLAEALGQIGPEGAEELTRILNEIFTPFIEQAHWWGGTVGKFAGDAISIFFTGSDAPARALSCAMALHGHITRRSSAETKAGTFRIQMKFGLAAGRMLQAVVGTEQQAAFVFAGPPLDDAAEAEHHASPGEIVLHPTLQTCLRRGQAIYTPLDGGYLLLQGLQEAASPAPLPPLPHTSDPPGAIQALRPFLPAPVYERLLAGGSLFVNEHRRVTVLFVHFDGIEYLSPDGPQRLRQYSRRVIEITSRFGGYVRQIEMGDKGSKAIVIFGAPIAHENDEERALLCALALQKLPAEFDYVTAQCIGVNSGRAFAGNVGSTRRQEYTVLGDAVNLAARLMQAADQGQVLVNETTYRAVSHAFTWRALPPFRVKGKTEPVTAHELTGRPVPHPSHLQPLRYALPMVGRQDELALLERLLRRVRETGEGHTIGLTAEAGMGKSRLAAEVIARALEMGFIGLGGNGVSHGATIPYLAWRPILRALLGLEGFTSAQQIEAARRRLAEIHPDLATRLPLLGDALGLEIPDNEITASFDAELRRESLFALVADLVRHSAASAPLLLVLEDAHWLDDLSRDLAQSLAYAITDLPVLFLTVYRPPEIERRPPLWTTPPPAFTEIRLKPFSLQESAELIRLKLAGRALPPAVVEQIEQRAQGNPFFVDEFINLIQDRGIDLEDPQALAALEIPQSLEALVISRMDQLSERTKMTLRVASVIGRLFRARWLLAIYPVEIQQELLQGDLEHLDRADLIRLDRPEPELEYLFKHAITQEVAYETLTFATRRTLHERVAEYIELTYSGDLRAWYGILAYHYRQAERPGREFTYVRLAAQEAARQSAYRQAAIFYQRAIELMDAHRFGTPQEAFDLRLHLFEQYEVLGEHKRLPALAEALVALAEHLDSPRLVKAQIRQGTAKMRTGYVKEAVPFFESAAALARRAGDHHGLIEALLYRGRAYFDVGDYEHGKAMLRRVIQEGGEAEWRQRAKACQVLGWIAYDEGDYEQTEQYWRHSLELARAHGHKPMEALVLSNLGVLYGTLNYVEKGIQHIKEGQAIAVQIGYKDGEAEGWARLGGAWNGVGQYERAWECYERALEIDDRMPGAVWGQSYIRSQMAQVLLETGGDLGEAERLIHRALEITLPLEDRELLGWLYYRLGQIRMRQGALEEACQALEESARLRKAVGQVATYMLTMADLGALHLQRGDLTAARSCADAALALMSSDRGQGWEVSEAISAGLSCFHILQATGEEARARDVLRHAYDVLQQCADRLETEELRRSFLERVSVHRAVVEAYHSVFGEAHRS